MVVTESDDVAVTVKFIELESLKPVVRTVTGKEPALAMSPARMLAVNWSLLTKVVVRAAPFHKTVELLLKLNPLTVRVKAERPASVAVGLRPVMVGCGEVMLNVSAPEVPPPGAGLVTVTCADPALATSEARIVAVT